MMPGYPKASLNWNLIGRRRIYTARETWQRKSVAAGGDESGHCGVGSPYKFNAN
ncbi:hypothetical protein OAN94_02705 [Verrucomicrobiales bacterium]|jgi:hypothetical protein|nr:hypothetical protein [Verrucomicrobiales bacterium]